MIINKQDGSTSEVAASEELYICFLYCLIS